MAFEMVLGILFAAAFLAGGLVFYMTCNIMEYLLETPPPTSPPKPSQHNECLLSRFIAWCSLRATGLEASTLLALQRNPKMIQEKDSLITSLKLDLEETRLHLNGELAKTNAKNQQLCKNFRAVMGECRSYQRQNAALETDKDAMEYTSESVVHENTKLRKAKIELTAQLSSLQTRYEGKEAEGFDLQMQIEYKAKELHDMTVGWENTKEALKQAEEALDDMQYELDHQVSFAEEREAELKSWRTNTAGTLHALGGQITDLAHETDDVRDHVLRLQGENAELQQENERLAENLTEVVNECEELQGWKIAKLGEEFGRGGAGADGEGWEFDNSWHADPELDLVGETDAGVEDEVEVEAEADAEADAENEDVALDVTEDWDSCGDEDLEVIEGVEVEGSVTWLKEAQPQNTLV